MLMIIARQLGYSTLCPTRREREARGNPIMTGGGGVPPGHGILRDAIHAPASIGKNRLGPPLAALATTASGVARHRK